MNRGLANGSNLPTVSKWQRCDLNSEHNEGKTHADSHHMVKERDSFIVALKQDLHTSVAEGGSCTWQERCVE